MPDTLWRPIPLPAAAHQFALAVCFAFNTLDRLADAFGFFVPGPEVFEAGSKFLLARGYR